MAAKIAKALYAAAKFSFWDLFGPVNRLYLQFLNIYIKLFVRFAYQFLNQLFVLIYTSNWLKQV